MQGPWEAPWEELAMDLMDFDNTDENLNIVIFQLFLQIIDVGLFDLLDLGI